MRHKIVMLFFFLTLFCIPCVHSSADVKINEQNFPELCLRYKMMKYDLNGDQVLSEEELKQVKEFRWEQSDEPPAYVQDFTGLSHLKYLEKIDLSFMDVRHVNFSDFKYLKVLLLSRCYVEKLNVRECSQLQELEYSVFPNDDKIRLEHVFLGEHPMLEKLFLLGVDFDTFQFDIRKYKNLKLFLLEESNVEEVVWSNENNKMAYLALANTRIKKVNLKPLTELYQLFLDEMPLSKLDVSKNNKLLILEVNGTKLKRLDATKLKDLKELVCRQNQLKTLKVNSKTLKLLSAEKNRLNTVEIKNGKVFRDLSLQNNPIKKLKLGNLKALKYLNLSRCPLKRLDLSRNPEVRDIEFSKKQRITVKVGKNKRLKRKLKRYKGVKVI